MSNNDWVQAGTPREDDWADEQDDYGVPVSPVEWDDYAAEQSVPVPVPDVEPAQEPDAEPQPDVEPQPEAEPEPEPEPEVDAEPEPEAEFEALPVDEPQAEEPEVEAPADEEQAEVDDEQAQADQEQADEAEAQSDEADAQVDETDAPTGEIAQVEDEQEEGEQEEVEEEPTQVVGFGRSVHADPLVDEPTVAVTAPVAAPIAAPAEIEGLFRSPEAPLPIDQTQRINLADEAAEERRIAEQLRAEKEARDQRLGLVATSDANAVRVAAPLPRPGVGRLASFGLLLLRLVTAGLLGVIGYQILSDIDASAELLGRTMLPEPRLLSWIVGFGLAALAVLLVIGLAVRIVGFLMAVVAVGALVFLRWGAFSIFRPGVDGFIGDRDLLLATIGLLFLCVGGGRAGVDAAFSLARYRAREAKRS
ncbi:MAG: DoxX family protein [Arachnia sp.]